MYEHHNSAHVQHVYVLHECGIQWSQGACICATANNELVDTHNHILTNFPEPQDRTDWIGSFLVRKEDKNKR